MDCNKIKLLLLVFCCLLFGYTTYSQSEDDISSMTNQEISKIKAIMPLVALKQTYILW